MGVHSAVHSWLWWCHCRQGVLSNTHCQPAKNKNDNCCTIAMVIKFVDSVW